MSWIKNYIFWPIGMGAIIWISETAFQSKWTALIVAFGLFLLVGIFVALEAIHKSLLNIEERLKSIRD
jgi:hypothetical protein